MAACWPTRPRSAAWARVSRLIPHAIPAFSWKRPWAGAYSVIQHAGRAMARRTSTAWVTVGMESTREVRVRFPLNKLLSQEFPRRRQEFPLRRQDPPLRHQDLPHHRQELPLRHQEVPLRRRRLAGLLAGVLIAVVAAVGISAAAQWCVSSWGLQSLYGGALRAPSAAMCRAVEKLQRGPTAYFMSSMLVRCF